MAPSCKSTPSAPFGPAFPLGGDLTDSKTLFAVLFWLAAFLLRKKSRWWTVAATVLMVAVYLIPHSLLGSELDYKTGEDLESVLGGTDGVRVFKSLIEWCGKGGY